MASSDTPQPTSEKEKLQLQGEHEPMPWWSSWLHYGVTTLLVIASLAATLWIAIEVWPAEPDRAERTSEPTSLTTTIRDAHTRANLLRLELALEILALGDREYPSELRTLVSRGLLAKSDLYYPSGRLKFDYSVDNDRIFLNPSDS